MQIYLTALRLTWNSTVPHHWGAPFSLRISALGTF